MNSSLARHNDDGEPKHSGLLHSWINYAAFVSEGLTTTEQIGKLRDIGTIIVSFKGSGSDKPEG